MSRMLSLAHTEEKQPRGRAGQQLQEEKQSQTCMAWPPAASQADAEATPLAKGVLAVEAGQGSWWSRTWVTGPDSSPLKPRARRPQVY